MKEFSLGKTDNRSVLGTMKQFESDLTYDSPHPPINLNEPVSLSLRLVDNGSLVLPEFTPREAVLKLARAASSHNLKPTIHLASGHFLNIEYWYRSTEEKAHENYL